MSTEGHYCDDCWCDSEHGCICDNCDLDQAEMAAHYRATAATLTPEAVHAAMTSIRARRVAWRDA